ncbi:MAG: RraA family protein [Acidimicrobiia bacterium]
MLSEIERPSPELIARFVNYRSSDMSDAMNRAQTMSGIRTIYEPVPRVVGPAVTVNSIVPSINAGKIGLDRCQPGDVLVVACPAAVAHAVWGGNLAYGTKSRGVAGLIIDGAVRDVSEIRDVGLPTFARHIVTMAAPIFTPQGEVNVPIACGGVVVFPGDIIIADDDGIVVVPPAYAGQVMEATDAVNAKAASVQEILGRGEITNLAGIRSQYRDEGFENA